VGDDFDAFEHGWVDGFDGFDGLSGDFFGQDFLLEDLVEFSSVDDLDFVGVDTEVHLVGDVLALEDGAFNISSAESLNTEDIFSGVEKSVDVEDGGQEDALLVLVVASELIS